MLFRLSFSFFLLAFAQLLAPSVVLTHAGPPSVEESIETRNGHAEEGGGDAPRITSLKGPVLGFIFDPVARSFRPILGIPGASTLGKPLNLDLPIENVAISPGQDFALATVGSERIPAVLRLGKDLVSILWIEGALPAPAGIFLSPSGTAAVLYYQGERRLQVVSGLPSSPSVVKEMEVSHLPADLTALAVSDDGVALLLGFSEGGAGSVFLLTADGTEQFVLSPGEASAITFLTRSADALITDRETNRVYLLKVRAGTLETFLLADERDSLSGPSAVAVTEDNRWAFILNSGGGTIVGLSLVGGPPRFLSCSCQTRGLHRLMGSFVFRLTEPSEGPLWLLDGDPSAPRIVFVPPADPDPQAVLPRVREEEAPR